MTPPPPALPNTIRLYDGVSSELVDARELAGYVAHKVADTEVEVRADFLEEKLGDVDESVRSATARRLAEARVHSPDHRAREEDALPGEISFEERFLTAGSDKPSGMLYDGHMVQGALGRLFAPEEVGRDTCHIVLTGQVVGTWRPAEARYHARAAVFGMPSIISTTGLVVAPARPREYYVAQSVGRSEAQLPDELRERFLRKNDPRIQEAMKGYLLQALFYHVTGDPFCEDQSCRLYNAHWQEELLDVQLRPDAGLCERHERILEELT